MVSVHFSTRKRGVCEQRRIAVIGCANFIVRTKRSIILLRLGTAYRAPPEPLAIANHSDRLFAPFVAFSFLLSSPPPSHFRDYLQHSVGKFIRELPPFPPFFLFFEKRNRDTKR